MSVFPEGRHFTLPMQVICVDAKRWGKRFWHSALEKSQVQTASLGVLSRLDEVTESRANDVRAAVSAEQPKLAWASVEEVAAAIELLNERFGRMSKRLLIQAGCSHENCDHDHNHDHSHSHEHEALHHLASREWALPARVAREKLDHCLRGLPQEVLRVKGVVGLEETPESWHVFQQVGAGEEITFYQLPQKPVVDPLILMIGSNLPEKEIEEQLATLSHAG